MTRLEGKSVKDTSRYSNRGESTRNRSARQLQRLTSTSGSGLNTRTLTAIPTTTELAVFLRSLSSLDFLWSLLGKQSSVIDGQLLATYLVKWLCRIQTPSPSAEPDTVTVTCTDPFPGLSSDMEALLRVPHTIRDSVSPILMNRESRQTGQ